MAKSAEKSLLIKLIEAGNLARHLLAAPLAQYGLEMGDDALILALANGQTISQNKLAKTTGLSRYALSVRLRRLTDRGLVIPSIDENEANPKWQLTDPGKALAHQLTQRLKEVEVEILGASKPVGKGKSSAKKNNDHHRWLKKQLKQFLQ